MTLLSVEQFEILILSLLTRPEDPAVILLGHFSQQTYQVHGYAGPLTQHRLTVLRRSPSQHQTHLSAGLVISPGLRHQVFCRPRLRKSCRPRNSQRRFFQAQICIAWNVAHGKLFDVVSLLTAGNIPADTGHLCRWVGQRQGVPRA